MREPKKADVFEALGVTKTEAKRLQALMGAANADLYDGPNRYRYFWKGDRLPPGREWTIEDCEEAPEENYVLATWGWLLTQIREMLDSMPYKFYVDGDGCVSRSEPEGFQDEETNEWVEPPAYRVYKTRKFVLGKELASYL